jgi:hypothetical protein
MQEYELMFNLTASDWQRPILGCADGPASFNAEMNALGRRVISCDPIYALELGQIKDDFAGSAQKIMTDVRAHPQNYVWHFHRSPESLLQCRKRVMELFAGDFPAGLAQGRYVAGQLPALPFATNSFELALCSHLLFLYSGILPYQFHLTSILELSRVANEVRLFPLTSLDCELSPHVRPLLEELPERGLRVDIIEVRYQLQRNGNQMMRVRKQ